MFALNSEFIGAASIAVAALAYVPYLKAMLKGKIKPHAFTWVLWAVLTWTAFVIQVVSSAGPGAWATGVTAIFSTIIGVLAFKWGEKNITRSDWISLICGLMAIPLWVITRDPTWSAILVTAIDASGYYPTFRKSWHKPHEEMVFTHLISNIKHILSLMALTTISIPTAFYPAVLVVMNFLLVGMIVLRRLTLQKTS